MIDGKQNVVAWFAATSFPYWIIYQRGKTESGNPSYKSDEREGVTNSDACIQLRQTLAIIGRGQYSIIASANPKVTAKGTYREDFEISINETQPTAAAPAINGPAMTQEDVALQVKKAVDDYKREVEMENLKKELAEVKKEKTELEKRVNDPWNKIAGVLEPYAPAIVSQMFPAKAQVAGMPTPDATVEPTDTQTLTDEENERLATALSVFAQHDADWLNTLERMAAKLQQNPAMINALKSFL